MRRIPLFPLSAVLLPDGRMPLRIFESRYLSLVRHSLRTGEPFGVVWIRRGSEVAQRGRAAPDLGDWGTLARIVDWDQLPDGLLGITIEGGERFDLFDTEVQADGLLVGEVVIRPPPAPAALSPEWQPLAELVRTLQAHPHIERMQLSVDESDAWRVAWTLVQLLPLHEHIKYELLGLDSIDSLRLELNLILSQIGGED